MRSNTKLCNGYRHLNHSNDTKAYGPTDSEGWEIGYLKPASSENGVMRKMVALSACCFVPGIQVWGKHMLGRKDSSLVKDSSDVADN